MWRLLSGRQRARSGAICVSRKKTQTQAEWARPVSNSWRPPLSLTRHAPPLMALRRHGYFRSGRRTTAAWAAPIVAHNRCVRLQPIAMHSTTVPRPRCRNNYNARLPSGRKGGMQALHMPNMEFRAPDRNMVTQIRSPQPNKQHRCK